MTRLDRHPYLCLITPGETNLQNFDSQKTKILTTVRDAVDDGVNVVQIREKLLPGRALFDLAKEIVAALRNTNAVVFINDRPDVAIASGAHGVHLPETSLSPSVVRATFGKGLIIGVSTHSIGSAIDASKSGADYLFFGPVFETPGKGEPVGLDELRNVCDSVGSFPVFALGGIDETNAEQVFAIGASVAAIRALNDTESRRYICETADAFKLS